MVNVKHWMASFFAIITLLLPPAVFSAEKNGPPNKTQASSKPKVCLVLAGGGAKGLAHIGVIKELERLNVPIHCIAGTSMGALVGGLYASGLSIEQIENFATHVDWNATFNDNPPRHYQSFRRKQEQFDYFIKGEVGMRDWQMRLPTGVIQGQQQDILIESMLLNSSEIKDFDRLPIPFRAVATDIETGQPYVLSKGNLATALRASMSVPGIFAPVEIDDHLLVDGGITNNTPISVAKEMGADIVIVSDIHDKRKNKDKLKSFLDITSQLVLSLTLNNTLEQLKTLDKSDILIRPQLDNYTSSDFGKTDEIIYAGQLAVSELNVLYPLLAIAKPTAQYPKRQTGQMIIDQIMVQNLSGLSDAVILNYIRQQKGQPFDRTQLETDLAYLYGLGYFQSITYDISTLNQLRTLIIKAEAPDWGPNFFKFKFDMASNLGDQSLFNLGVRHTHFPVNALGAEWRNEIQIGEERILSTELYQPMTSDQKFYVRPYLRFRESTYSYTDQDLGIYSINFKKTTTDTGVETGINLNTNNRLAIALYYDDGKITFGSGTENEQIDHYYETVARISYQHDSLDQTSFPSRGTLLHLSATSNTEDLTDLHSGNTQKVKLSHYHSFDRHTLNLYGEYANLEGEDGYTPKEFYTLGGFQRLSGFKEQELLGDKIAFARLKYQYRILGLTNNILNFPFYVGATAEVGNVYGRVADNNNIDLQEVKTSGSVYAGFNSLLGPVYIAYGYHSEKVQSVYFYFGRDFD